MHPDNKFRRGDFYSLKNLELRDDALCSVIDAYRYWIALSDCDGFRIDTVKRVPFEASRNFCGGVREYAEWIGKENFLLLGEVTGGAAGSTRGKRRSLAGPSQYPARTNSPPGRESCTTRKCSFA